MANLLYVNKSSNKGTDNNFKNDNTKRVNFNNIQDLKKIVNILNSFASQESSLNIIRHIKISGSNNLNFTATDLDKWVSFDFLDKKSIGLCLPNPKKLYNIINKEKEEIDFFSKDNNLHIKNKSGNEKKIDGMLAEDVSNEEFKEFSKTSTEADYQSINAKELSDGINKVVDVVDSENFNPILKCVNIEKKGNELIFTGTDTFGLVNYKTTIENTCDDFNINIEKTDCKPLLKVFKFFIKKGLKDIKLYVDTYNIYFIFQIGSIKVNVRSKMLNSYEYPDYDDVINRVMKQSEEGIVKLNKKLLEDNIKKIVKSSKDIICLYQENNQIRIATTDDNKKYTIKENDIKLYLQTYEIKQNITEKIVLNGRNAFNIINAIKKINSEYIILEIHGNSHGNNIIIKDENNSNRIFVGKGLN